MDVGRVPRFAGRLLLGLGDAARALAVVGWRAVWRRDRADPAETVDRLEAELRTVRDTLRVAMKGRDGLAEENRRLRWEVARLRAEKLRQAFLGWDGPTRALPTTQAVGVWRPAEPGDTPGELTPQLLDPDVVRPYVPREYGTEELEKTEAAVVACAGCGQPAGAGHVCAGDLKEAA